MLREVVLLFLFTEVTSSFMSDEIHKTVVLEEDRWNSVCGYLKNIMLNDEEVNKGFIELFVFDATNSPVTLELFMKHLFAQGDKLIRRTSRTRVRYHTIYTRVPDFGFIVFDSLGKINALQQQIRDFRYSVFPKLSMRIFVVFKVNSEKKLTTAAILKIFDMLPSFYLNIRLLVVYPDRFEVFELRFQRTIKNIDTTVFDFPFSKMGEYHANNIGLAQWDSFIFSYVENGRLMGLEGKVLDTFCEKYGIDYIIRNKETKMVNLTELLRLLRNHLADLNMNTETSLIIPEVEVIELGEIDGTCLLAPRNIYASSYASSYPFDLTTTCLIILATVTIVFLWRVISMVSKSNFELSFIIINIYKCFLGQGVSKEEKMSKKEKILIYSYVIGSMVFVSLYQSVMISIMLAEPTMKSVQSFKELNDSQTRIFKFLLDGNYDVVFRDEIIMTRVESNFSDFGIFQVPSNFDRDLAYIVQCSYADSFLSSSRNYEGTRRLFDKIPENINSIHQLYTVSTYFPLLQEFKTHVEVLRESGIRNFWKSNLVDDNTREMKVQLTDEEKKQLIDFKSMIIPFSVLITGCAFGAFTLTFELFIYYFFEWKKRQVKVLNKQKKSRRILKRK